MDATWTEYNYLTMTQDAELDDLLHSIITDMEPSHWILTDTSSDKENKTDVESQKAGTAHFKTKQLLPSGSAHQSTPLDSTLEQFCIIENMTLPTTDMQPSQKTRHIDNQVRYPKITINYIYPPIIRIIINTATKLN